MIFDATKCALGEGPLWHPRRETLFWFDILNARLFERGEGMDRARMWQFTEHVSAAGWIDQDTLLIASETALFQFDLNTSERTELTSLEADNPVTRSNDGRADAWGGFWIGTMGKQAQPKAGAIYRFYQGKLVKLFDDITISNAICFSPDATRAYFTDTPTRRIMQVSLDKDGWPIGSPDLFADVAPHNPDGAVVDAKGNLWNAQWGSHRVACYDPEGAFVTSHAFEASQISCPTFGGKDLTTLFATSAADGLSGRDADIAGQTFCLPANATGQTEHQIKLG